LPYVISHAKDQVQVAAPKQGPGARGARLVDRRRESNGKKKGAGDAKCGHKPWAWACQHMIKVGTENTVCR
jgi:hypothetical protein